MKNFKLKTECGNTFSDVAENAKEIALKNNVTTEFDFNGIKCIVNKDTNLKWLNRDYCNAFRMEWKTVGPDCLSKYNQKTQKELNKRNKLAKEKEEKGRREYDAKCKTERELFESKTKGINVDFSNKKEWDDWKSKQKGDGYGLATFEYAENWAKLMQKEMAEGISLIDCAEKTSHELGFLGITGFMYGMAVQILSRCWKHGETLRKWHNKEYNHKGDGVVNPAVLTLKS